MQMLYIGIDSQTMGCKVEERIIYPRWFPNSFALSGESTLLALPRTQGWPPSHRRRTLYRSPISEKHWFRSTKTYGCTGGTDWFHLRHQIVATHRRRFIAQRVMKPTHRRTRWSEKPLWTEGEAVAIENETINSRAFGGEKQSGTITN